MCRRQTDIYSLGCCVYELMTLQTYVSITEWQQRGNRRVRRSHTFHTSPSSVSSRQGLKNPFLVSRRTSCYRRRTTCSVREDKACPPSLSKTSQCFTNNRTYCLQYSGQFSCEYIPYMDNLFWDKHVKF